MESKDSESFKTKVWGFFLMLVIGFVGFSFFGVIILILLVVMGILPRI